MRDNVPGRFTRSFFWNLNQYAGWNFDGDRLYSGGNVNMHWTWKNYWTQRLRRELQRRAVPRPRHARRARRARQPQHVDAGTTSAPTAARACRSATTATTTATARARSRHGIGPYVTWRPTQRLVDHDRLPLQHQQRRLAVGDERGDRRRADALRVRPSQAAHGRRSRSASTTR